MALPLITAIVALGTAIFGIGLFSHVASVAVIAPTLAALIGLGVGIDYALFIVTRYREGLKAGLSPEDATVRALNTAGRAVMFAGGTVCIALLGLLVLHMAFLNGLSITSAGTVLVAMAAAMTLLPALFGFMGVRVLSRRERQHLDDHGARDSHSIGFWARWSRFVARRPVVLLVAAAAVLRLLAVPYFSLRLGLSDAGNDKAGTTARKAYDMLAASGFGPGFNGPLVLVAQTGSSSDQAALGRLEKTLSTMPGVAAVAPLPGKPGAKVMVVEVFPTTAPQDVRTSQSIKHLRNDVIPPVEAGTTLHASRRHHPLRLRQHHQLEEPSSPAVIVVVGFLLLRMAGRFACSCGPPRPS